MAAEMGVRRRKSVRKRGYLGGACWGDGDGEVGDGVAWVNGGGDGGGEEDDGDEAASLEKEYAAQGRSILRISAAQRIGAC
ncbi:Protein of unknown function [Pyronema omphalodes CBS 100304]|uniref:Uncharacterized protein n=1 Tax=Pyronema omphalodes (strain CBS 100304) TaxID=1076935 RepID=U4L1R1_PYROM|nr:Protein of unknown function [Pyronema omphalodes CBS 100304]